MQILIFDCPCRSMLIRQKCQKALWVTALYFAAYGLAAEILNTSCDIVWHQILNSINSNLLTLSLCIWQASSVIKRTKLAHYIKICKSLL